MGRFKDLTGQKFNKLTVIAYAGADKHGHSKWLCLCDCGSDKQVIATGDALVRGKTKSCGCLNHIKGNKYKIKSPNQTEFNKDMFFLIDEKGNKCCIDLEDYERVKGYYWYKNREGYWCSWDNIANKIIKLHRFIMEENNPCINIDHRFGNKDDNRKSQLRRCTIKENVWNSGLSALNKTSCPGVVRYDYNSKYNWQVTYSRKEKGKNKKYHIGLYEFFEEAVFVRKTVELLLKGEFVRLDKFPRIKLAEDKEKELKEQTIKKLKEKKLL